MFKIFQLAMQWFRKYLHVLGLGSIETIFFNKIYPWKYFDYMLNMYRKIGGILYINDLLQFQQYFFLLCIF